MDTLQPPFFEKMIKNTLFVFSGLVNIRERIEQGLKSGKIPNAIGASSVLRKFSRNFQKKIEEETNVVMIEGGRPCYAATTHVSQPQPTPVNPRYQHQNQQHNQYNIVNNFFKKIHY